MAGTSADFLALHAGPEPLLLGNAWDAGSATVLAALGFRALATTSSGHAATLGRRAGEVTRDEALAHSATIAGTTGLPVSADLEDGFADDPAGADVLCAPGLTDADDIRRVGRGGATPLHPRPGTPNVPATRFDPAGGRT